MKYMVRPTRFNKEEISKIREVLKLEVSEVTGNKNWSEPSNLKSMQGAKKDTIKTVLENYNRGELKSEDARKIIKKMNSAMGQAGEMVPQVYGVKIKQTGGREDFVKRIRNPKISDFRYSNNAQMKMLDKIAIATRESEGGLYLANKEKNRRKYLEYLQEEEKELPEKIYTISEFEKSAGVKLGNPFDFTHCDSVTKCSIEMWRNGTAMYRLGAGIAFFANRIAELLFQPLNRDFSLNQIEQPIPFFPTLYQRSCGPNQPSEAVLESLASQGKVLEWIHNVKSPIHTLGSHRTNDSFNVIIGDKLEATVHNLQIETDLTSQDESNDMEVGIHEIKCEKHSDLRVNFARYQVYNPARKVLNRYQKAGDEPSELKITFMVGHWKGGTSELGIVLDVFLFKFTDNSNISTMTFLRKRRFEFTP